VNGYKITDMNC